MQSLIQVLAKESLSMSDVFPVRGLPTVVKVGKGGVTPEAKNEQ
jgi:hypothetical protein